MALSDIVSEVDLIIARGDLYDTDIKAEIWRAHRHYEREYNLKHMHTLAKTESIVADTRSYSWSFSEEVKAVRGFWRTDDDGNKIELPVIPEFRVYASEEAYPTGVVLDGRTGFRFDNTPSQAFTLETELFLYTTRDDSDEATSWLIENADDLLIARAVMRLAAKDADPELFAIQSSVERELRETLINSELEFTEGGTQREMIYADHV